MRTVYQLKEEDKEQDYYSIYIYANSFDNPGKRDEFCFDACGLPYRQLEAVTRSMYEQSRI